MRLLGIIRGDEVRAGVFADPVRERGHELEEWSIALRPAPSRPLGSYDAVLVFGGSMHADEEATHPWLLDEEGLLRRFLDARVPVIGVCIGAQIVAKAARDRVCRSAVPAVVRYPVALSPSSA